jgi:hypothetical protein
LDAIHSLAQATEIWAWMHGPGREAIENYDQPLDLSRAGLTALPTVIGLFRNITSLNLTGNQLTTLPLQIENLIALRDLNLSSNQFDTIPPEIKQLRALENLNLKGNPLNTFPELLRTEIRERMPVLNANALSSLSDLLTIKETQLSLAIPLLHLSSSGVALTGHGAGNRPWSIVQSLLQNKSQLNKNYTTYVCSLSRLSSCNALDTSQKSFVLESLCNTTAPLSQKMTDLGILLDCKRADLLLQQDGFFDFKRAADTALEELLPGLDLHQYAARFGPHRNPDAIRIYAGRMAALVSSHRRIHSLRTHIASVLDGSYSDKRYSIVNNPHLLKISKNFSPFLDEWRKNFSIPVLSLIPQNDPSSKQNLRAWLVHTLVKEKALGDLTHYPDLQSVLLDGDLALKTLKEKINNIKSLKPEQSKKLALQHKLSQLFDPSNKTNALSLLKELSSGGLVRENENFQAQITQKIEEIVTHNQFMSYTVHNTDDYVDFLFMGNEGIRTCQAYDAEEYNIGLLGSWLNGQSRLIAVKDEQGRIMTRCLLRLFWDGTKPVLYEEPVYGRIGSDHCVEALNKMIEQTAMRLGCSVLKPSAKPNPVKITLRYAGGPAPEYMDCGLGIVNPEMRFSKSLTNWQYAYYHPTT